MYNDLVSGNKYIFRPNRVSHFLISLMLLPTPDISTGRNLEADRKPERNSLYLPNKTQSQI